MENKLGMEPAFSSIEEFQGNYEKYWQTTLGMSKRFYAACAAMQGILASVGGTPLLVTEKVIKLSYEIADELLAQENK